MRKLLCFTIGFSAATCIAAYLMHGKGLLIAAFLCLVCALILLAFSDKKSRVCRLLFLGCALAFAWNWGLNAWYLSPIRELDGDELFLSVEIDQYSKPTDYGITADGLVTIDGKPYKIRIYSYDDIALKPADRLDGVLRLRFTANSTHEDIHYAGRGIYLVGNLQEEMEVTSGDLSLRHYPAVWRQNILELMKKMLPEDTFAFAQALLLGEQSALDYETNTNLTVSGIRHVVAVSGLHVSILLSVVFFLFGERRILTPIVGITLLLAFAAMTGFTPSVVRACAMYALYLLAITFLREYDAPTALSFAVLVMLIVNPMAVTSVSMQLSVACVIGILLFSKRLREFLLSDKCFGKASPRSIKGKLQRWIADSFSVTVSTMITTMPLCGIYFGAVSVLGIFTNLLVLWLISFIFIGLLCSVALGFIWLPLGQFVCWLISFLIRLVLIVARLIASVPFAAVYTQSPYIIAWIVFFYGLLAVFLITKKKSPWLMVSCALAGLLLSVGLSCMESRLDNFRFTMLDVGDGQCILIQNEDRHYLIDCGGDSDTDVADLAAETLLSQGITHLDGVILTHYDADHSGALDNLLTRISTEQLILPKSNDANSSWASFENVKWIENDSVVEIPEMNMTIFAPLSGASNNESSLCILFQPDNCDILITGDRSITGERALLEQTVLPQVEVLVVGHHGAKDSASLELLTAVKPKTAVISVGEDNHYGHPSADVLERLNMFGCKVLRTDIDGTIMIRG